MRDTKLERATNRDPSFSRLFPKSRGAHGQHVGNGLKSELGRPLWLGIIKGAHGLTPREVAKSSSWLPWAMDGLLSSTQFEPEPVGYALKEVQRPKPSITGSNAPIHTERAQPECKIGSSLKSPLVVSKQKTIQIGCVNRILTIARELDRSLGSLENQSTLSLFVGSVELDLRLFEPALP
ncbi:hypothetical protein CRG98_017277 [Punica granatum]|uniref:Uncharacterized protein n=1 Tax=Punica granatum TaxID=22663 RepID=A0A2I0K3J1_PUNGR|nr:hypothetical protein CRG98_017277 [Punica granatum]